MKYPSLLSSTCQMNGCDEVRSEFETKVKVTRTTWEKKITLNCETFRRQYERNIFTHIYEEGLFVS